jgi:hypothetical protein
MVRGGMRRGWWFGAVLVVAGCGGPRANGPLPQEAYVWQRSWGPGVSAAVAASPFDALVVWAAEADLGGERLRTARAEPDWPALAAAGRVGLALRVGPSPLPLGPDHPLADDLVELAAEVVAEARRHGVAAAELQLDFDSPTSQLAGYAEVVAVMRRRVAPLPVVVTALPSWLGSPGWRRLAAAADGFVLQVHALELPAPGAGAPPPLCDPAATRRAVEAAARAGRPFRVALPTYGYEVAWDGSGTYLGVVAEGPERAWPPGARRAEVAADPTAMAALVRSWTVDRPAALAGVLWFRLPVAGDRRNWSPQALAAVAAGRPPRRHLGPVVRFPETSLAEVDLVNGGETAEEPPPRLEVRWRGSRLLAADGLGGYRAVDGPTGRRAGRLVLTRGTTADPVPPGGRRATAWLRFAGAAEVEVALPGTT